MTEHPKGALTERRRYPRISAKGTVTVKTEEHELRGRIGDLGLGGILVRTDISAPEHMLARIVDVEVRLDSGHAAWLQAVGRIGRIDAQRLAICFDEPPTALLHMIDEISTASRARDRVISVVLIDAETQRRSAMAAGFRAAGCLVIEASTPLEAIVRLGESSFELDVIAIADSYPTTDAVEMRSFVERCHPRAKLVTIGDELFEPDGIAHWLSSANPDADLSNRVRDVLVGARTQAHKRPD